MFTKRVWLGVLLILLVVPAVYAQKGAEEREHRREIMVYNNWHKDAHVTIKTERHDEHIKTNWTIAPKLTTWLGYEDMRHIKVRSSDRIKANDDMKSVRIGDVASVRDGHWFVEVRDVVRGQRDRDK